jgi:hypothetical protein
MWTFFSSGGDVGATMEAARGRSAAPPCLASMWEEEDDRWPVGPAGRPRPVGRGGKISRLEKKEWAAAGPKGQIGRKLRRIISE